MSKVFTIADDDVMERIERLIAKYHPDLNKAGVRVGAMFVHNKKALDVPILEHHGYPAAAVSKINNLEKRVQGHPDATITIDGPTWSKMPEEERDALIDHELTHLMVKKKDGEAKLDTAGRPKLHIRLHDWQLGGFAEISRRHGKHALEAQQVKIARDNFGQLFWQFGGAREGDASQISNLKSSPRSKRGAA